MKWYKSIVLYCAIIASIIAAGVMIFFSFSVFDYRHIEEGTYHASRVAFIGGLSSGAFTCVWCLISVILFILAFNLIGQCLSCACCCCSCGGCVTFFAFSIFLMTISISADEMIGFSKESVEIVEQKHDCCIYENVNSNCYNETATIVDCREYVPYNIEFRVKLIGIVMCICSLVFLIFVALNIQGTLRMNEKNRNEYLTLSAPN